MKQSYFFAVLILIVGFGVIGWLKYQAPHRPPKEDVSEEIVLPALTKADRSIKEVESYLRALKEAHRKDLAFLPLDRSEIGANEAIVQDLLLKDESFNADRYFDAKPTRNEMMRIVPALPSHLDDALKQRCQMQSCYLAEKYNFATNTTTRAIVDLESRTVLQVRRFEGMQTEINHRLRRVAEAIALNNKEVRKKWKKTLRRIDMSMSNVRANAHLTPCEDSRHLCVAPTFADTKKERALWAVVDLTDLRLAVAKWAPLGKSFTPACVSERVLQNRYIMEHLCQKETTLQKGGWELSYILTPSDGLEIRRVSFQGKEVLRSAKIVDWHVSYSGEGAGMLDETTRTYIEGREVEFVKLDDDRYLFGYNDAMGCPMFSTSAVLAFGKPRIEPLENQKGFALIQDFRNPKWPLACNYRYENRFEFYDEGSFRITAVNKGRGCGASALYRPVMRIDLGARKWRIYREGEAKPVAKEFGETVQKTYRLLKSNGEGFRLLPDRGQYPHSRGDHARIYVSVFRSGEGDTDLLTLGSCCNLQKDGPERYINGESITDASLVVWYVPRIANDNRPGSEYCWADSVIDQRGNLSAKVWPCAVGPLFEPIKQKGM